jgi:AraC-like DNA-binding protein
LDFEGPGVTETVCPFFQAGFVEHAADSLRRRPEQQLDDIDSHGAPFSFPEQLYPKRDRIAALLLGMRRSLRRGALDEAGLEDTLYLVAEAMVRLRQRIDEDVDSIAAVRAATRRELYRRLHRGRDYLASCYHEPLTVEAAARVAHMSPYHFHRMFRAAFGQTSMQYLQDRRLSAAVRLLAETDASVTSICLAVGFESLGSFSWLFRKRVGQSPREFRARRLNGRK